MTDGASGRTGSGLGAARLAAGILLAAVLVAASAGRGHGEEARQGAAAKSERNVIVGTAPVAGSYYPAGGALCRLVNAGRAEHGLRCLVEATAGAVENLQRLKSGDLDFALVQSDWQYHAYHTGLGTEEQKPFTEMRSVLSLHALPFTLLAAPNGGIASLADLEGKRINLGGADTPWRAAADYVIEALGWEADDFAEVGELGLDEQALGLCDGRIDAFLMPISHPSNVIQRAAETCGARLLPIEGEAVDRLLAEWAFYAPAVIPGGVYPNNPAPVHSFGVRATLVTTEAAPAEAVYEMTKAVFEGLEALRAQYAAFAGLTTKDMVEAGHSAPLHEGALRYYREQGWR